MASLSEYASIKFDALRSIALQCGHTEEELTSCSVDAQDAELLLKCFERELVDYGGGVQHENHYWVDTLHREKPRDNWSRIQIQAGSFLKAANKLREKKEK